MLSHLKRGEVFSVGVELAQTLEVVVSRHDVNGRLEAVEVVARQLKALRRARGPCVVCSWDCVYVYLRWGGVRQQAFQEGVAAEPPFSCLPLLFSEVRQSSHRMLRGRPRTRRADFPSPSEKPPPVWWLAEPGRVSS